MINSLPTGDATDPDGLIAIISDSNRFVGDESSSNANSSSSTSIELLDELQLVASGYILYPTGRNHVVEKKVVKNQ